MIDPVRTPRRIREIGREDKALQRCTLSARSMPGDGQEHRPRLVLLPSHPSSGRKATNLLNWGAAPSQANEWNYPQAVGHMSRLVVRFPSHNLCSSSPSKSMSPTTDSSEGHPGSSRHKHPSCLGESVAVGPSGWERPGRSGVLSVRAGSRTPSPA